MGLSKKFELKNRLAEFLDPSILKGAGTAFIIKVLGAGASFGLQVALARLLSLEDYGSYTYIMAWTGMVSGFASLGFTTSLIRFIPEYVKKEQYGKLKGVIKTSVGITLICSLLFALIGMGIIVFVPGISNGSGYSFTSYLLAGGILIGLAFLSLFGSLEKGKKHMFMAHAPRQLFKHLLIGTGILLLWFFDGQIDVQLALWVTFGAVLLLVSWHLLTWRKGFTAKVFISETIYKLREWLKVSLPLLLISGFMTILNRTDVIMLGIFSTKAQVGIYNVAYKVATLTSFILIAVNAIAAPTIAELYHEGKMEELQQFARRIAHLIFWPTLVLSAGLVVLSGFILGLFGKEFVNGKLLLIILLVGQLAHACVGSVGYYLNMNGYERESARVYGVAGLVNIVLNARGIYFYGAVGAAVVTTLTTSMWNIWMYVLVKRKVDIKSAIV